jgi:large subunit ribosomal protein L2
MANIFFKTVLNSKKSLQPKSLSIGYKSSAGCNYTGRKTFFHKGGARKILYRIVDFFRSLKNIPAIVRTIEKDPLRSSAIALLSYSNELLSYIIAPAGLKINQVVFSSEIYAFENNFFFGPGYSFNLHSIPLGIMVHNIEILPNKGAQYMRASGCAAQIIRKFNDYTILKLKSGEHRLFSNLCMATIGIPSAFDFLSKRQTLHKAGLNRLLGKRPIVRGCAMNPIDHPHGGNTSSKFGSFTPWGKISKGKRTAKYKLKTLYIIKPRFRISDLKKNFNA